jgi:hypothetical protein
MHPNFRVLNNLTIKDNLPILIIVDLLDEIHGAKFFTKIYFHFDHHQIQMKEEDISMTTFHTNEDHYEFLMMPSGLCNTPSTL